MGWETKTTSMLLLLIYMDWETETMLYLLIPMDLEMETMLYLFIWIEKQKLHCTFLLELGKWTLQFESIDVRKTRLVY